MSSILRKLNFAKFYILGCVCSTYLFIYALYWILNAETQPNLIMFFLLVASIGGFYKNTTAFYRNLKAARKKEEAKKRVEENRKVLNQLKDNYMNTTHENKNLLDCIIDSIQSQIADNTLKIGRFVFYPLTNKECAGGGVHRIKGHNGDYASLEHYHFYFQNLEIKIECNSNNEFLTLMVSLDLDSVNKPRFKINLNRDSFNKDSIFIISYIESILEVLHLDYVEAIKANDYKNLFDKIPTDFREWAIDHITELKFTVLNKNLQNTYRDIENLENQIEAVRATQKLIVEESNNEANSLKATLTKIHLNK